jgi:predicted transcriptional regulator
MAGDTVVLTVRIPVALQQQLDTVAQAIERSRAWVITQALEYVVAVQAGRLRKSTRRLPRLIQGILPP